MLVHRPGLSLGHQEHPLLVSLSLSLGGGGLTTKPSLGAATQLSCNWRLLRHLGLCLVSWTLRLLCTTLGLSPSAPRISFPHCWGLTVSSNMAYLVAVTALKPLVVRYSPIISPSTNSTPSRLSSASLTVMPLALTPLTLVTTPIG